MNKESQLSPGGRLVLGLLCAAMGALPMLAAFDIGPLGREDINGPPWLGVVAGGIFVLAGIGVAAGDQGRHHPLSYLAALGVVAGLAAIPNWIAFGPGPRECSVAFSGIFFGFGRAAAEMECRIAFGIGAGIMDGVLVWMLAATLRRCLGPSRLFDWLEKAGQGILLLALAPILLAMLAVLVGKSGLEALGEYRRTGRWPRNEAFAARMRKKKGSGS